MTTMISVHLCYAITCIGVTFWVARTLRIHGQSLMAVTGFEDSPLLRAKTELMVVGFYLITLGLVGFALRFGDEAADVKTAIELLSTKIGGMIFVIGLMHFFMVGVFMSSRKELPVNARLVVGQPVADTSQE